MKKAYKVINMTLIILMTIFVVSIHFPETFAYWTTFINGDVITETTNLNVGNWKYHKIIDSGDDFMEFIETNQDPEAGFVLGDDIIINISEPIPIFNGQLDGNGHTIINEGVIVVDPEDSNASVSSGLFGNITEGSSIKNVVVQGIEIEMLGDGYHHGDVQIGGLVGVNYGLIENVAIKGGIINHQHNTRISGNNLHSSIGGLVAVNAETGIIRNAYSTADVIMNIGRDAGAGRPNDNVYGYIGGLAGRNYGIIENSYTAGNIIVNTKNIRNNQQGIRAFVYAGGLVGEHVSGHIQGTFAANPSITLNSHIDANAVSYHVGLITANDAVINSNNAIIKAPNNTVINTNLNTEDIVSYKLSGIELTIEELQTFNHPYFLNLWQWDTEVIWAIIPNSLPILKDELN